MADILVVDDEPTVRKMMRRWLKDAGYDCREAGSAEEALEVMASRPADLAFCDVQMPGESGIWLTGQLRRRYPGTAVVLATGVTTVPPNVSMQAGVMAYLVKPIQQKFFLAALKTAIAWHQDTAVRGPIPEDTGDRLTDWLDTLKEL
jgi:DNA-binding NtrC family response regulator